MAGVRESVPVGHPRLRRTAAGHGSARIVEPAGAGGKHRRTGTKSVEAFLELGWGPVEAEIDPNSPTPILLSQEDSTRALTGSPDAIARKGRSLMSDTAFAPGSKVNIFVTNLDLMEGEGANAFRVYAEDAKGRHYRFPVLDIQPLKGNESVYAVTVLVRDDVGFFQAVRAARADLKWSPRRPELDENPETLRRRLSAAVDLLAACGCPPLMG